MTSQKTRLPFDPFFKEDAAGAHLEERLTSLTFYNRFTGLPNRLLLKDRIEHALLRASGEGKRLALLRLFLRCDHRGKSLFGAKRSDRLLPEVAGRMKSCIRQGDTLAHLANDDFVVLLEESDVEDPGHVARRILRSLSQSIIIENEEVNISASIGIAVYPEDGNLACTLLRNAGAAVQRAAKKKCGSFRFFNREMNLLVLRQQRRRLLLSRALARQELGVHYQPLGDPIRGKVESVEALLRWHHPKKGTILPEEFIPDLEKTGLIGQVGNWVLRKACLQLRQWRARSLSDLKISVNVSIGQLALPDFPMQVKTILEESGLDPSCLILEIPETAVPDPLRTATLMELAALGVQLSMDDFGAGGSSLGHLTQFPLHSLKMDRRLVEGIPHRRNDVAVASAIIAAARSLGIRVAAKGVETREQLAFFHSLKCREIQGFLFAHPMPAAELDNWIDAHSV